jgi:polar amino acid transport system substrate-binding protein
LLAVSVLAVACGTREYRDDRPVRFTTAANCIVSNGDNLYTTGGYATHYLTVATGDPASPPWWEGGTTAEHPEWQRNDPYLGRGFEGAVAFEVAERLGFSEDDVRFVPIGFHESFAPGDKDFDFALQQIADVSHRAKNVDFSEGYYDVSQALVSVRGSPIAGATSVQELKDATLGAPTGAGSLAYIEDTIHPKTPPPAYADLRAAVRALQNGHVDGIVADLPNAAFVSDELAGGVLVGRLPSADPQEHFAMAFEKGSPIVECVNLALGEMKDDGTLAHLRNRWLADETDAPLIGP